MRHGIIVISILLAGIILPSCKQTTEPIATIIPKVVGYVVGVTPEGQLRPLANTVVMLNDSLRDTASSSGWFQMSNVRSGVYRLRLADKQGEMLLDSTITISNADTIRLRVKITKQYVQSRFFTFPLAVGNEWVYEFTEQSYHWPGRYKVVGSKVTGTYTWRVINNSQLNDSILYYTTIGIRSMTIQDPDSKAYSIQDTVMGVSELRSEPSTVKFTLDNIYIPSDAGRRFIGGVSTTLDRMSISTSLCPLVQKDTLTVSGSCDNYTGIGGCTMKFVHNVGIVSISGQSLSIYAPTDCQYTLKSYTLKK